MRFVEKDLNDVPPSLSAAQTLADLEKIALKDASVSIKSSVYKGDYKDGEGKSQSRVREILNKFYKNKCAYCEQTCKAEIEHYRPKKGVNGITHDGYYWLCYSWSNLIPSCRYCNTEGGKGNHFPILNDSKRVIAPSFASGKLDIRKCNASSSPLIDEVPYLLHPEIDKKPEEYLTFKISDDKNGVSIVGIDKHGRGHKTIEICNLNRNDLRLNRLTVVFYPMKQIIKLIFDLNVQGKLPDEHVGNALKAVYKQFESESSNVSLTHTLLRKFVILNSENFENHFLPYLGTEAEKSIALEAFKAYKST
jgi:hypothetical protein